MIADCDKMTCLTWKISIPYSNNFPERYLSRRFLKYFKGFSVCICVCIDMYVLLSALEYDCRKILKAEPVDACCIAWAFLKEGLFFLVFP